LIARGLINAAALIEGGELAGFVKDRYAGWQSADAQAMLAGKLTLESISDAALAAGVAPTPKSGRQEWLENIISYGV
jgi:xylose isomerase